MLLGMEVKCENMKKIGCTSFKLYFLPYEHIYEIHIISINKTDKMISEYNSFQKFDFTTLKIKSVK